jgi:hypothetical protein
MPRLSATSPRREKWIERVTAQYERQLAKGFPTAPLEGQPEPERLQCRNVLDRTNWLGLVVDCQLKIALGYGDVVEAGTLIRCTSNRMYQISPNDALARMAALLTQADLAQRRWWELKDQVRVAETDAALEALDLEAGWP